MHGKCVPVWYGFLGFFIREFLVGRLFSILVFLCLSACHLALPVLLRRSRLSSSLFWIVPWTLNVLGLGSLFSETLFLSDPQAARISFGVALMRHLCQRNALFNVTSFLYLCLFPLLFDKTRGFPGEGPNEWALVSQNVGTLEKHYQLLKESRISHANVSRVKSLALEHGRELHCGPAMAYRAQHAVVKPMWGGVCIAPQCGLGRPFEQKEDATGLYQSLYSSARFCASRKDLLGLAFPASNHLRGYNTGTSLQDCSRWEDYPPHTELLILKGRIRVDPGNIRAMISQWDNSRQGIRNSPKEKLKRATKELRKFWVSSAPDRCVLVVSVYGYAGATSDPAKLQANNVLFAQALSFVSQFGNIPVLLCCDAQEVPHAYSSLAAAFANGSWHDPLMQLDDAGWVRPDAFRRDAKWPANAPRSSIDAVLCNQCAFAHLTSCEVLPSVRMQHAGIRVEFSWLVMSTRVLVARMLAIVS